MKRTARTYLIFLLMGGVQASLFAQRHVAGLKAVEIQGGVSNQWRIRDANHGGYTFGIGYSRYFSSKSYWKICFDFDRKNYLIQETEAYSQRYLAGLAYYRTLIKDRGGHCYVNASFGALVGYEDINGNRRILEPGLELKAQSRIVYGLSAGMEAELYLIDRLALIAQLRERWLIPSDAEHFRWYLGMGLKWVIP